MPSRSIVMAALSAILLLLAAPVRSVRSAPQPKSTVLLELFTSQGCSSCPPADRLLRKLARDQALAGRVVPLAFHVDYWNDLGWRDPFSAASWSQRQRIYAARQGASVYTPQLVIDGASECVGSNEATVRRYIAQALGRPDRASIRLELDPGDGVVRARVRTRRLPGAPRPELVTYVVLFEDGLVTPVPSGENAGRSLENDRVVRKLVKVDALPPNDDEGRGQVEIALDRAWRRENLGVVAFAQPPGQSGVSAVAEARLTAAPR